MVFTYPDFYTDEDKALYDDLICRGKLLIGTNRRLNFSPPAQVRANPRVLPYTPINRALRRR